MNRLKYLFGRHPSVSSRYSDYSGASVSPLEGVKEETNLQQSKSVVFNLFKAYKNYLLCSLGVIIFVLYNVYLIFVIIDEDSWNVNWCHGIRIILIITFISYGYLFYYKVIKFLTRKIIWNKFVQLRGDKLWKKIHKYPVVHLICFAALAIYTFVVSIASIRTFTSYAGIWVLLLLGFVFSKHHTQIRWRQVCWGLNLQFVIGLVVLHFQFPSQIYYCLMDKNKWISQQVDSGASFVFGYLITGQFASDENISIANQGPLLAFQMFSDFLVFSMIVGILHQCKITSIVINYIGEVAYFFIGTNTIESTVAVISIIYGFKDCVMFVRHYMPYISVAELYGVASVSMCTNSGSLYGSFRHETTYTVHSFLADLMSIMSALTMTRLLYPDIEKSRLQEAEIDYIANNIIVYNNVGESVVRHIFDAIRLSGGIIATGIVFVVFPNLLDDHVEWFAAMAGLKFDFVWLLANLLTPFVYIVGIEWNDCFNVAKAIATKLMYEEMQGYEVIYESKLTLRSQVLAGYLLNDTANVIHLAFNIATISILVPSRLTEFIDVLTRSFFTALSTSWLTACIAGCLMSYDRFKEPFDIDVQ